MKIYTKLLDLFLDLNKKDFSDLTKTCQKHIIEVEEESQAFLATGVFTGFVKEKTKHPDSDHLSVLKVEIGSETFQIVCGAKNVASGQTVLVAKAGATLPEGLVIKDAKIRGVSSSGMVCSLEELGFNKTLIADEFKDGIFYFKEKLKSGIPAEKALFLEGKILTLGLTPNRGDLLSVYGFSRDLACALKKEVKLLKPPVTFYNNKKYPVKVMTEKAEVYSATIISDIKTNVSPEWLKSALICSGYRPVNLAVDISNYVQILFGTPLHTFDLDKLDKEIIVREAKPQEKIVLLDKKEALLNEKSILISSEKRPLALAGVMGGFDSMVDTKTQNVLLEAAIFDPNTILKQSKVLALKTDSSQRFEKGVAYENFELGLNYALYLFMTLAGAKISTPNIYRKSASKKLKQFAISSEDAEQVLGVMVDKKHFYETFSLLGFEVKNGVVTIPERRFDLTIKEDLIEEYARFYGYDNLLDTLPKHNIGYEKNIVYENRRKLIDALIDEGFSQINSYSLVSEKDNALNNVFSQAIKVLMPLSLDHSELRTSLFASLLSALTYNFTRQEENISLFEFSKIFTESTESEHLGVILTGCKNARSFKTKTMYDFYDIKAVCEKITDILGVKVVFKKEDFRKFYHPERALSAYCYLDNKLEKIGDFGEIHPQLIMSMGIKKAYFLELNLEKVFQNEKVPKIKPVAKVLSQTRDISFVCEKNLDSQLILDYIIREKSVKDAFVFDVYDKLSDINKKALSIRIVFIEKELSTDLVNLELDKTKEKLKQTFKLEFR